MLLCLLIVQGMLGHLTIQPAEFQSVVERYFSTHQTVVGHMRTSLEFRSLPAPMTVPLADYRLSVDDVIAPTARGNMSVAVSVVAGGSLVKKVMVPFRLRTFGIIAIAARQLEQHAIVQQQDLLYQERETTTLPDGYVTDGASIEGKRTKKIITAGSVLRMDSMEQMPAVYQNADVLLIVRSGAVRVSSKATAKSDGVVGQLIQIQRQGSHERLYARVVGPGVVEAVSERMVR